MCCLYADIILYVLKLSVEETESVLCVLYADIILYVHKLSVEETESVLCVCRYYIVYT